MEWLQTYKIGKALIDNEVISPIESYYRRLDKSKEHWIVTISIDFQANECHIEEPRLFGEDEEGGIKQENIFMGVTGNYTDAYLCTPYGSVTSILDFFGVKHKFDKSKKLKSAFDIENKYVDMLKKGNKKSKLELSKELKSTNLFRLREAVTKNKSLKDKLKRTIYLLPYLIEKGVKESDYDKIIGYETSQDKELSSQLKEKYNKLSNELNIEKDTPENILSDIQPSLLRLDLSQKSDKSLIVRVKVIDNSGESYILNQLPEYQKLCFDRLLVGLSGMNTPVHSKCYFSGEDEVYDVSFPRDSIDILKISTNSDIASPNFIGSNFFVSKNAYNALKIGAKYISRNLRIRISEIDHYIIPDFRTDDINIEDLTSKIKRNTDIIFQLRETDEVIQSLEEICNHQLNSLTLVGHVKDDKKIELTNVIKVPSAKYFDNIFNIFQNLTLQYSNYSEYSKPLNFRFANIYGLFVERYRKDGNKKVPLFKPKSLEFFKMILEKHPVEKAFLLDAYKQLINVYKYGKPAKEGDSYYGGTLNVWCGKNFDSKKSDFKIAIATKKYQVLFNLIRELGIEKEKSKIMENKDYEKLNEPTQNIFKNNKYKTEHKALFFLGKMLHRVANAQHKKGAKHKPVLDKINYSGMNFKDLIWLSCEVFDKMRQYNKSLNTFNFGEDDMAAFKFYFDQVKEDDWLLSEVENVFSIFSGYALYWDTLEKSEAKINEEKGITRESTKEPVPEG